MGWILETFGKPPAMWSRDFEPWIARVLAAIEVKCPLARGTTFYISDTGGADGSGLGTLASPFVATSLQTLVDFITDNTGSGDVLFLLRRGGIWRGTGGIEITQSIAIGDYGNSYDPRPCICGFSAAYAGSGWTQVGTSATYYRTEATAVYGARYSDEKDLALYRASALDGGGEIPALASGFSGGWFWDDAADRFYIRRHDGAAPGAVVEPAKASGSGIIAGNSDGIRLQNLEVIGWGMESDVAGNYNIRSNCSGDNNAAYVVGCSMYWGPPHVGGHIGGGPGDGGGAVVWDSCDMGLAMHSASGSTAGVSYANDGGNDCLLVGNRITHGGQKTTGAPSVALGEAWYAHTSNSALYEIGVFVAHRNYIGNPPRHKFQGPMHAAGGLTSLVNKYDHTTHNVFISREFWAGTGDSGALGFCPLGGREHIMRFGCKWGRQYNPNFAAAALQAEPVFGVAVCCEFEYDLSAFTNGVVGLINGASDGDWGLVNCFLEVAVKRGQQVTFDFDINAVNTTTCGLFNTITQCTGGGGLVNVPNAPANQSHCAYYGFNPGTVSSYTGYNAGLNPVTLPTPTAPGLPNALLAGAGGPLPAGMHPIEIGIDGLPFNGDIGTSLISRIVDGRRSDRHDRY